MGKLLDKIQDGINKVFKVMVDRMPVILVGVTVVLLVMILFL